jgi:hypothetical protein
MLSQNLRVKGPRPVEGESPNGEALAKAVASWLSARDTPVCKQDIWRDSGWALRTAGAVEVVIVWADESDEWFLQVSPTDGSSFEEATRIAEMVTQSLSATGKFTSFRWAIDRDPDYTNATASPQVPQPASSTSLEFPALAISRNETFLVVDAVPTSGTAKALRSGYFHRLAFLDREGRIWPVLRVHPREATLLDRILNRAIPLTLFLGPPEVSVVADIAEHLCALVDRDPDDLFRQRTPPSELKTRFREAMSARELIDVAAEL